MSDKPNVYVAGVGMITPVGANAEMTAAMVRAGLSSYEEVSSPDLPSESIIVSMIPEPILPPLNEYFETEYEDDQLMVVEHLRSRAQRMIHMALLALRDLGSNSLIPVHGAPLLLGLPEQTPLAPYFEANTFLNTLFKLSGIPLHTEDSAVYCQGRTAALCALAKAVSLIQSGQHDCVLVGSVDSLLDMDLLEALDEEQRLLSHDAMSGFVAGEGAVILALCASDRIQGQHMKGKKIQVGTVGIADEKGHRYSEDTYTGDGLAEAFQFALNMKEEAVSSVIAGLNGEEMMAKEWGVAIIRNQKSFKEDFDIMHPADSIGDLGAASGGVQLGLATIGLTKGYIQSPCLVWSSSDRESRAAVCLNKVD